MGAIVSITFNILALKLLTSSLTEPPDRAGVKEKIWLKISLLFSVIHRSEITAVETAAVEIVLSKKTQEWSDRPTSDTVIFEMLRFIVIQNVDDVDVTSSLSIRSSASREHVALQFYMPVGGCGCVFVWFQGL